MPARIKYSEAVQNAFNSRLENIDTTFTEQDVKRAARSKLRSMLSAALNATIKGTNPRDSVQINFIGKWQPVFDKPRAKKTEAQKMADKYGKLDPNAQAEFKRLMSQ